MGKKARKNAAEKAATLARQQAQPVLDQIAHAFDGAIPPDPDQRTLEQAAAWDHYAIVAHRAPPARWQDVPVKTLLACPGALPHLGAQAMAYYLPALMSACLRQEGRAAARARLAEAVEQSLTRVDAHQRQQLSWLTRPQRAAVHAYLVYTGASEAGCAAWAAATR